MFTAENICRPSRKELVHFLHFRLNLQFAKNQINKILEQHFHVRTGIFLKIRKITEMRKS